jgi:hypothetical protein
MPKVKISEYSATANSNTDVASINIDEGCAPSGINNAIRAVMGHLKDFQQGTNGDPFNGPVNGTVGATTPASGAFTTLSATGNVTLGDASTDTLNVGNGGLIKDSSGNLGLGVTPSAWDTLLKAITVTSTAVFSGQTNAEGMRLGSNWYYNSGFKYQTTGSASRYDQSGGAHSWHTAASGTAGNPISFTQAMTLNASGLLGIGQTSPQFPLHITGASGVNTYAHFTNATTGNSASDGLSIGVPNGASDAYIIQRESANLFFYTNALERAAIDASGNLLVGTTSQNTSERLNVTYAPANTGIVVNTSSTPVSNSVLIDFLANGTRGGVIVFTNLGVTTAYVTSSDYRLKENIQPMTGALAKVAQLKPVTYKWKNNGSNSDGFIAHELAEVCPQAVNGEKDAVNEDGSINPQGIDTSFLVATLTAAIQEQQALITQLTARITALEGA